MKGQRCVAVQLNAQKWNLKLRAMAETIASLAKLAAGTPVMADNASLINCLL